MQYKRINMANENKFDLQSDQNQGGNWNGEQEHDRLPTRATSSFRLPFRLPSGSVRVHRAGSNFKIFVFLESYLNLCYYLFLVPFRLRKGALGQYEIKTNIIQQIFSSLLLGIITIFSLLDLRHYHRKQKLREKPDETFQYATIFIVHWIPLCWLIVFWVRRSKFTDLIKVCETRFVKSSHPCKSKFRWWRRYLKFTISLIVTKNTLFFYNEIFNANSGSFAKYMDHVKERFLYDFGLMETPLSEGRWPVLSIAIGYLAALIHFMNEFIIYMFDQLCFTAAAMAYATCQHFLDEFRVSIGRGSSESPKWNNNDGGNVSIIKQVSSSYLDLIAVLDVINRIFGPCVVLFFMYIYPLFIWSVFDSLQNNSLIENLIRVHDMSVLCLVTGTAAEASSKIEVFRQWLFEAAISSDNEEEEKSSGLLKLATMHREVSSEGIGLKGYKFFTVTYRFVATMIGVVITYAIVMFQFVTDPRKANKSGECICENKLASNFSAQFNATNF